MQVIKHPNGRLHTALLSTRKDLIEAYQQFFTAEKTLLEEGLKPSNTLYSPITIHSDTDWIPANPEDPQDFQSFYSYPYRKSPSSGHRTIYIQKIGSFGEGVVAEQFVKWLKDYCQAFYYGLEIFNLNMFTGELLDFLKRRKPKDAFCIVGITMIDLYPKESWNFIFGQASLTEGMGVFSFARYDDHFYESNYAGRIKETTKPKQGDYSVFQNHYTTPITSTVLMRSCKALLYWIEEGDESTRQPPAKPTQAFQEYRHWLHECLKILEDNTL